MSRRNLIGGAKIEIVDAGGLFARFKREAPKEFREAIYDAVEKTSFALAQRMRAMAPVGPEAPHIRDHISYKRRGARAEVGYLDATQEAGAGSTATIADVALFNEYAPNKQPFMRPAAEMESKDFDRRVRDALKRVERDLSGGGGLR